MLNLKSYSNAAVTVMVTLLTSIAPAMAQTTLSDAQAREILAKHTQQRLGVSPGKMTVNYLPSGEVILQANLIGGLDSAPSVPPLKLTPEQLASVTFTNSGKLNEFISSRDNRSYSRIVMPNGSSILAQLVCQPNYAGVLSCRMYYVMTDDEIQKDNEKCKVNCLPFRITNNFTLNAQLASERESVVAAIYTLGQLAVRSYGNFEAAVKDMNRGIELYEIIDGVSPVGAARELASILTDLKNLKASYDNGAVSQKTIDRLEREHAASKVIVKLATAERFREN